MAIFTTKSTFSINPFRKTRTERAVETLGEAGGIARDITTVASLVGCFGRIVKDDLVSTRKEGEAPRTLPDIRDIEAKAEAKEASQERAAFTKAVTEMNGMMKFMPDHMREDMEKRNSALKAEAEAAKAPVQEEPEAVKGEPEPAPVQPKPAKKSPKKS